jgi:hypothetical protein
MSNQRAFMTIAGMVALGLTIPASADNPRSYYPTLTPQEISVCRPEFAAIQAEAVQHYQLERARYSPGGEQYEKHPDWDYSNNIRVYTNRANEIGGKDPVTFYVDGITDGGVGQGIGGLATLNELDGEIVRRLYQDWLSGKNDGNDDGAGLEWNLYRNSTMARVEKCVGAIWMKKFEAMHGDVAASTGPEPGPLGLQNMPAGSAGSAQPASASVSASADGDVFGQCVKLEDLGQSGIQHMWRLRNVCNATIKVAYCFREIFAAAGDTNMCDAREYDHRTIASGSTFDFPFSPLPDGTALSDGRVVADNQFSVVGYACGNGSAPDVYFNNGKFLFQHC